VWVTSIPEPPVSSGHLYTAWSLMRAPAKSYEITEAAPRLGAPPKSRRKKRFRGHARADAPGVKGRCIRRRCSSVRQVFATMWATIVMNWVIATLIVAAVVVWIIVQWRIWRSRAVR
jgi:hypothetical protein